MTTPDGLIFNMYGPEVESRHEITLYTQSEIDEMLIDKMIIDNRQFHLYGDQRRFYVPGYRLDSIVDKLELNNWLSI